MLHKVRPLFALQFVLCPAFAAIGCSNEADPPKESSASQGLADGGTDAASCEPPADPTATCHFASVLMKCRGRAGAMTFCLGECDAAIMADQGIGPEDCENICAADEYAAGCGGIGPMAPSNAPPSEACHGTINPGGSALYCCPCE